MRKAMIYILPVLLLIGLTYIYQSATRQVSELVATPSSIESGHQQDLKSSQQDKMGLELQNTGTKPSPFSKSLQSHSSNPNEKATTSGDDSPTSSYSLRDWIVLISETELEDRFNIIQSALDRFPYAAELLLEEALFYKNQGDLLLAIETLGTAHTYAENELATTIDELLISWLNKELNVINQNSEWQYGQQLFDQALRHFHDLKPLKVLYAELLVLLNQFQLANSIVSELEQSFVRPELTDTHHHELESLRKLESVKATIKIRNQTGTTIPLRRINNHFIAEVLVSQQVRLGLMLDTGASLTVVKRSVFEDLASQINFRFVEDRMFNTAGGVVQAPIYQIDTIQLGPFTLTDARIAVIDFGSSHYDGLLGMNLLKQFEFSIDQQESFLLLKPRLEINN